MKHQINNKISLYSQMGRIRSIEVAIAERYYKQQMRCPVHLSIGQEAVAVGVCTHLTHHDYAFSTHRAHAHYLAKGGDLNAMIAEIHGKSTGCSKGRGGSMHLIDLNVGFMGCTPIVGGSIPVAAGAAFGVKLKKENRITAVFFGEGATEEGVFAESLNFAALENLPILFVCENNLYSVYSPLFVRQSAKRNRPLIAQAHGILALEGDGMDVDCVSQLTKIATDWIKEGKGPAYIEFSTYRFKEHCGPHEDPYQPELEKNFWYKRDPLKEWNPSQEVLEEIENAFSFAEKSPFPKGEFNE